MGGSDPETSAPAEGAAEARAVGEARPPDADELANQRAALEASGDYRVLERLKRVERYHPAPRAGAEPLLLGLYLDVETTGFSWERDRVIELAFVAFEFDKSGRIYRLLEVVDEYEDPGRPIPPEITRLTGISDEMVSGKRLDEEKIRHWLGQAQLVIAHNAAFDRPFAERRLSDFEAKAWACSMRDVDWSGEGLESSKLEYLAYKRGFFYDTHRASNDCLAGVHLLSMNLPGSGQGTLAALLQSARRPTARIWAVASPFESKDLLRERGYRWNAEIKAWFGDVGAEQRDAELAWLGEKVYPRGRKPLPCLNITARERYSQRVPDAPPTGTPLL